MPPPFGAVFCCSFFIQLHEYNPKCFRAPLAKQRRTRKQLLHSPEINLIFIPLEYQYPEWFQYSHALTESLPNIISPGTSIKYAVFFGQPRIITSMEKMRWVKYHQPECLIIERHISEISNYVRLYLQAPPIAQRIIQFTVVHEYRRWIGLVKPEHPGSAACIKYRLHFYLHPRAPTVPARSVGIAIYTF